MRSGASALSDFRTCSNFIMAFNDMLISVMLVYLFLTSGRTFSGL